MECVRLVAALRSLCVPSALAASLDRESQSGDQSHALHKLRPQRAAIDSAHAEHSN